MPIILGLFFVSTCLNSGYIISAEITEIMLYISCTISVYTWSYENQILRKKGLFWLRVLEILVHGQLARWFWVFSEATHHGGKCLGNQAAHLTAGCERERKEDAIPLCPSRAHPQWPEDLPLGSISKSLCDTVGYFNTYTLHWSNQDN
jgi:hypothetical protein